MSLKAKLQRMKEHLVREAGESNRLASGSQTAGFGTSAPLASASAAFSPDAAERRADDPAARREGDSPERREDEGMHAEPDLPHAEKWRELQAEPYVWEGEYVMIREVAYPAGHRHGAYAFSQLREAIAGWEAAGRQHPLSAAGLRAEDLLFFDTETTGLSGGTGNTVFLLGYSRLEGDRVVVRQHFLPAPHAEFVLYRSFLEQARKSSRLVTFNGKAFDWPQVKTRHTLLRDRVDALPSFGHLDLLHGARRLWKDELESCRLSLIEQEKLKVKRQDDLPGYLAPIRYFDFLHSRDPQVIEGVLRHNEWDVLSLITLYIHLSSLLLMHDHAATVEEQFAIARWYEALGEQEAAITAYRLVADSSHPWKIRARFCLGQLYKRQRNWQKALEVWESCMQLDRFVPEEVYIEAAKLCEHQLKDEEKALYYTKMAYAQWKKRATLLRQKAKAEALAYEKRIARLEEKLGGRHHPQQAEMDGLFV